MTSFNVQEWLISHPPQICDAASISQPTRLGVGWTKDGAGSYLHGSTSGLSALHLPNPPVDLNEGIEKFVKKSGEHAGVEILIKAALTAGSPLDTCQVLTFRNNLNKIMGTVHDQRSWIVDACMLSTSTSQTDAQNSNNSTLFLDIVNNEDPALTEKLSTFMAWGYQFEAKCTGAEYADANSEYGMLVSWTLQGVGQSSTATSGKERIRTYMGAEVDAFDPRIPSKGFNSDVDVPPLSTLREIKTFTLPQHPGQWVTLYRHKHPKWWLQSYLAGVPALVLGARDKQGVIREIHTVSTADLPRLSRQNRQVWSPQQALAFGAAVLHWMQAEAAAAPGQHLRFEYNPYRKLITTSIIEGEILPKRVLTALAQE